MSNIVRRIWHDFLGRPFVLESDKYTGSGTTIVLLHGLANSRVFWNPLVQLLVKEKKNVITMDLLGHGNSPKPEWIDYTANEQARAVIATLRRLQVRGRVVVVGHSMGALVGARVAAMQPRLVKSLVLYEPPIFADVVDYPSHARMRSIYFKIFERLSIQPSGSLPLIKILTKAASNWDSYLGSAEAWRPIERSLRNSIMQQSVYDDLRSLKIPVAVIHGWFDVIVTSSELKEMYKEHPNITFYKTPVDHGINTRSARFLAGLLVSGYATPKAIKLKKPTLKKLGKKRARKNTAPGAGKTVPPK